MNANVLKTGESAEIAVSIVPHLLEVWDTEDSLP